MSFAAAQRRKVYRHPATESGRDEKQLELKVPFLPVPHGITEEAPFVAWLKTIGAAHILTADGAWMDLSAATPEEGVPLPPEFTYHVRNASTHPSPVIAEQPNSDFSMDVSPALTVRGDRDLVLMLHGFKREVQDTLKEISQDMKRMKGETAAIGTDYRQIADELMQMDDFKERRSLDISNALHDVNVADVLERAMNWEIKPGVQVRGKRWKDLAELEVIERKKENRTVPDVLEGEAVLQLGLAFLFIRVMQKLGIRCRIVDTSLGGLYGRRDKPDFSHFILATAGRDYSLMLFTGEVKEDFKLVGAYKDCIGEEAARMRRILEKQSRRDHVYGYIADMNEIQFMKLKMEEAAPRWPRCECWTWTDKFGLSLAADSPGLVLLTKMLCAGEALHGFVLPPILPSFCTPDGGTVSDIKPLATKPFAGAGSPSAKGCVVYSAKLVSSAGVETPVALKMCPSMEAEIKMTRRAQGDGVLPILASGKLEMEFEAREYLITPLCEPLELGMVDWIYLRVIEQLAQTVDRLWQSGVVHGDISVGNVVMTADWQAWLIDFGAVVPAEVTGKLATTLNFAAVQTLRDGTRCLSSELECLMYLLMYLASAGKLPWGGRFRKASLESKMLVCGVDLEFEVFICQIKPGPLRDACTMLRSLFWKPCYNYAVTLEDFLAALHVVA